MIGSKLSLTRRCISDIGYSYCKEAVVISGSSRIHGPSFHFSCTDKVDLPCTWLSSAGVFSRVYKLVIEISIDSVQAYIDDTVDMKRNELRSSRLDVTQLG